MLKMQLLFFVGTLKFAVKTDGFQRMADVIMEENISQVAASTVVSHVIVQVITVAQCLAVYPFNVVQSTICTSGAGGVGICGEDSGGPLALNYNGRPVLIGVSSFAANRACQQGHPSDYARITSFRDFFVQHL